MLSEFPPPFPTMPPMLLRALVILTPFVVTATARAAGADDTSLWGLIKQGGWAMWPLGLCSLAVFALAIHAARETRRARFIPDALLPRISDRLGERNVEAVRAMLDGSRTVLARVMAASLERVRPELPDANKARVEESISETIEHEDNALSQWVNYLNVVATIAPMIGLLGTVSGMIGAFQTIGKGGMGRPELLAGDIGEALITTAAGLIIGIPAMVAYYVLRNRLADQIIATVQTATRLVDRLAGEGTSKED